MPMDSNSRSKLKSSEEEDQQRQLLDESKGEGNFHATLDLRKATIPKNRQHFVSLLWKHKHKTLAYCSVFWSFGMGVSFLGPTILDLGCKTGHVLADVSWIFFIQAFSILLGSAVAGPFIKKFTAEPILVVATITIATTLSIIPFCSGLHVLGTVLAVMGFFMGAIDTTANVSMIKLYGQDVSPFIHALHFCYGLGAFVSPMIAKPFLLNMDCSSFVDNSTESHDLLPENVSLLPANSLADAQDKTRVNYAFWIMSMLQVSVVTDYFFLLARLIQESNANGPLRAELKLSLPQTVNHFRGKWIDCGIFVIVPRLGERISYPEIKGVVQTDHVTHSITSSVP
ncbi:MFSD4 (predicted) [Pycnogonum litorale]